MGQKHSLFRPGDIVVYSGRMSGPRPGPAAQNIVPSENGESYTWHVEHYARILDVRPNGFLLVRSETDGESIVDSQSVSIRRLNLMQRLFRNPRRRSA